MRIITHALLSLLRKPTKAIMIFVILFVVFSLVFTGIIIQNSIGQSKEFVRRELGAVVEMKADYMKAMNDQLPVEDYGNLRLTSTLADEIAKDPEVKTLYIEETSVGMSTELVSAQEGGMVSVSISGEGEGKGTSFPLLGSNQLIPIEFENGGFELLEGRHRSESDEGIHTLLISDKFAGKNNLTVGDRIELNSYATNTPYTFEVIGIYSGGAAMGSDFMYTSIASSQEIAENKGAEGQISSISFLLHDPLDVDSFIARHKDKLPSEYLYLDAGHSEYKKLTKPLDLMDTITTLLLWVVFIAGVIIMIAIVTIFVRDRKTEIGLLLSSGEAKIKIVSQFVLEITIVSLMAFLLAAGTSRLSSDVAANWIINTQLIEEEELPSESFVYTIGDNTSNDVNMEDVAEDFNISIDPDTFGNLVLISFGLILMSASAPLMIILSFKPRASLQD